MKSQYLIILSIIILAFTTRAPLLAQITVPNGDFETPDNSSPAKTLNWVIEGNPAYCGIDKSAPWKGKNSMKIASSDANAMYFFNEEFPFTSAGAKRYKFSCMYRTKDLHGKIGLGARVFGEKDNTIMLTMFTLTEEENQEWQRGEGEFYSDERAVKLRIFGNITGSGEAWFDDIMIEEVAPALARPAKKIEKYVDSYFAIVNEYSILKDKNYITGLKSNTMELCKGISTMEHCHDILKTYTTRNLNDHHSFFSTPRDWEELTKEGKLSNGENLLNLPEGKMLDNGIAYLAIPMFLSFDKKRIACYADSIQALIAAFDSKNPKGWIVDLTDNSGGNSFAMLAGLGPLIGNGICGFLFGQRHKENEDS